MKYVMATAAFAAVTAIGCSDDGVATPNNPNDPPAEIACEQKGGCPDAGDDADVDATDSTDAGK